MKKIFRYTALLCASAAVAISCVEENLEPIIPAVDGDAIVFGVRAGFEDSAPGTKTEYSGNDYTTEDGRKFERIDWIENDKIEIYSPEADNPYSETSKSTHYRVTGFDVGDESAGETGKGSDYAKLANVGDAGLRWNGTQIHNFYAMYPSSEMFRTAEGELPSTIEAGVKMGLEKETNNVMVYGIIPTSQQPEIVSVTGGYVAKPDMDYAYMVAKTSVDPKTNNSVNLSFVPIVTAVEIELVNNSGETLTIGEIQIASEEQITGSFTANLSTWQDGAYPTCANIPVTIAEGTTDNIQITTRVLSGDSYAPVSLINGQSLKVTAFLLPGADVENLIVRVSSLGAAYTSKNLSKVNIKKNLKTRISGLELPKKEEFNNSGNEWMEQLPLETQMKALSLPGTGGSFTYNIDEETIPEGANVDWYKQQTLNFSQQWEQGIRVFEVVSEVGWTGSDVQDLASSAIRCNKQPIKAIGEIGEYTYGNTVGDAYRCVLRQLQKYPTEAAAIILTYQPLSNTPSRNATYFAQSLNLMLNTLKNEGFSELLDVTYSPDLTMEQAKGHLMTIVRINQKDEGDDGTFSAATSALNSQNVLLIDGCGTGKDRWGARGYQIKHEYGVSTRANIFTEWGPYEYSYPQDYAYDISNEAPRSTSGINLSSTRRSYTGNYVEYYMTSGYIFSNNSTSYTIQTNNGGTIGVTRPDPEDPTELNFIFPTNKTSTTCWFQEWARVVKTNTFLNGTRWTDSFNGYSQNYTPVYWFESYNEKLSNVITTFDMAIGGSYSNYIFINSLCGYLVDENIPDSTIPSVGGAYGGAAGNIKGLSDDLNPAFYNHVINSGMENTTGPTGIILMDYVSNNEIDGGAYYLPGAIISNNSKFDTIGGTQSNPGDQIGGGSGDANGGIIPF